MLDLKLIRVIQDDKVTLGIIRVNDFIFSTLELPWRNNQRNVSCIPAGAYPVVLTARNVYQLGNVPARDGIQIHIGNITADIQGCILLGMRFGHLQGQLAVLASASAVKLFKQELDFQPFNLTILDTPK